MPRDRSRTSDGSRDKDHRLEPIILRAAEDDNVQAIEDILETAKRVGQYNENLLRIGLMRSAEKDKINATLYLLKIGARPDAVGKRAGPLLRAVERGYIRIVKALLDNRLHPVDKNERDKKGRTLLMTAAWKGHWHILSLLINAGADINAKDARGRNVLHNLAADKQCDWGNEVVDLLLNHRVSIDGQDARDSLDRMPLHWCSTTGKRDLAEKLLCRKANVNAADGREKTSLHMAASYGRDDIVELLLRYKADVNATSDGRWTPLHNACKRGSDKIVRQLLDKGAVPNARLLNGETPLHIAAEEGHVNIVVMLLAEPSIRRTARDNFGFTAFLRAAQRKHRDCVTLLAPCNQFESLSYEAVGACQGFMATVTDFGHYKHENKVTRMSVYELLYGKKLDNPRAPAFEALPGNSKSTTFRWIHLPANNISWIEALMSKCFVEEGHHDVEGFKAIERSFTNQHRGLRAHAHFMRPQCQPMPRAPKPETAGTNMSDSIVESPTELNRENTSTSVDSPKPISTASSTLVETSRPSQIDVRDAKSKRPRKANTRPAMGRKGPSKEIMPNGRSEPRKRFESVDSFGQLRSKTPSEPKHGDTDSPSNIFLFSPFLHFETSSARKQMQRAIDRARPKDSQPTYSRPLKDLSSDELLIRAHLTGSSISLHVRRTLDQYLYHNIDTDTRDEDQVVFRYQATNQGSVHTCDPKIFMVDQLWMWVLGKDLIVTSFPQRWKQPRNDPLNVLDAIIEDVNSRTREPIKSVYDLALTITARCSGCFDRHRLGEGEYQFLDMFEASIGRATDDETNLFNEFNNASALASKWLMKARRRPTRFSKSLESDTRQAEHQLRHEVDGDLDQYEKTDPLFVDKLLDIGRETDLLKETKDIRDEISMLCRVLEDQRQVLPDLSYAICDIYATESRSQQEVKRRVREQTKNIDVHLNDLARMDRQAERIYKSVTNLLDLKQKHANAFEARFARAQAAQTARQSQTIMVFTIVTIIFLPLTFVTGVLTINISDFPRDAQSNWAIPASFAAKYIFGIGIAVSIPLIAIALSLDNISDAWRYFQRQRRDRKQATEPVPEISVIDEVRKSLDARSIKSIVTVEGTSPVDAVRRGSAWSYQPGHRTRSSWTDGGHLLPMTSRTAASYRS